MVDFHYVDIDFKLTNETKYASWVKEICFKHGIDTFELTYIFCSDDYLLDLNKKHLNHDYYTDIITFPLSSDPLSSDIFISIDRVKDNAKNLSQIFDNEILRVMSHGLLHLFGLKDKTQKEQNNMRNEENACIALF